VSECDGTKDVFRLSVIPLVEHCKRFRSTDCYII